MKKCCLPKIKKKNVNPPLPLKSINFSSPFSTLLKEFKIKNQKKKILSPTNNMNTHSNYLLTEAYIKKKTLDLYDDENFLKKEEDKMLIEGQKYLIKLYESNYSSLLEKIKTENKEKEKKNKILPSLNIDNDNINNNNDDDNQTSTMSNDSRHLSIKNKFGFNIFKKTNYVTPSCMRDFYQKYSNYNTISRK